MNKEEDALIELVELRALAQRGFTSLFQSIQRLSESHCPNVFTVLPKEGQSWLTALFAQKMVLQVFCQAPGQWHPAVDGTKCGRYEIGQPWEFLKSMRPYIWRLAKVIKYAAPVPGAPVGPYDWSLRAMMGAECVEELRGQIKLMEDLAKKLVGADYFEGELREQAGVGTGAKRIEGTELIALRALLDKEDPAHEWGGLKKVLTPEGHYLWLCEHHAAEYKV